MCIVGSLELLYFFHPEEKENIKKFGSDPNDFHF